MIDSQPLEKLSGETELQPPELFAANLIEWCMERRASDLFVSDIDGAVLVSVRRLGKIESVRTLAQTYGRRLQGHLRVLAGADAGDFVRPTEGRGKMTTPDGSEAQLRLSSIPTLFGQDVAIRLFDPVRGSRSIYDLGMNAADVEQLLGFLKQSSGLVLVTGPVAAGKSSTLYAMLEHLNDGSRKIHTIEDPVEHAMSGVMQSQVNTRAGLDFRELLSVVLRHSPDVIMIGEIRDPETAQTAIRAGASGQLVLATVHAKSCAEAVDMMLQYDSSHQFLASALAGVINQRLVPRLCEKCREVDQDREPQTTPERLRDRVDVDPPVLYRAAGCSECHDGGFDSLVSVPEIMSVDDAVSQAIIRGAPASELQRIAIESGMLTLAEVARSYVLSGVTTLQAITQVIDDPDLVMMAR